jgi:hypothetical protein
MVRFIKQEAEEKANEIRVSAEEVRLHRTTWIRKLFVMLQSLTRSVRAHTGVQSGEAAAIGAGEVKNPQGLREEGEPSGCQEEDVSNSWGQLLKLGGLLVAVVALRNKHAAPNQNHKGRTLT